jgi:hypothetical protein
MMVWQAGAHRNAARRLMADGAENDGDGTKLVPWPTDECRWQWSLWLMMTCQATSVMTGN